jgi:membrane protease YdiL (CAAX protease family)
MSEYEVVAVEVASEQIMDETAGDSPPALSQPNQAGGWDLIKVLGICWSADVAAAIVLMIASVAMGYELGGEDGMNISPWAFIILTAFSTLVLLWACWNFACARYDRSLAEGLMLVPVSARLGGICAAVGVAIGILASVLHHIFPPTGPSFLEGIFAQPSVESPLVQTIFYPAVVWAILAAVVEEVYYRGFLYTVFRRMFGAIGAMAIIMLWFWVLHIPQYVNDLVAVVSVGVASVLLTWLRHRYDSIWPPIMCHVAYNATVLTTYVVQTEMQNAAV